MSDEQRSDASVDLANLSGAVQENAAVQQQESEEKEPGPVGKCSIAVDRNRLHRRTSRTLGADLQSDIDAFSGWASPEDIELADAIFEHWHELYDDKQKPKQSYLLEAIATFCFKKPAPVPEGGLKPDFPTLAELRKQDRAHSKLAGYFDLAILDENEKEYLTECLAIHRRANSVRFDVNAPVEKFILHLVHDQAQWAISAGDVETIYEDFASDWESREEAAQLVAKERAE